MDFKRIAVTVGFVLSVACLDRKKANPVDGAISVDAYPSEAAVLPGSGGAPGFDSPQAVEVGQPLDSTRVIDGPAIPDVPLASPEVPRTDSPAGTGGSVGTGGSTGNGGGGAGTGGAIGGGTGGAIGSGTGGATGAGGTSTDGPAPLLINGSPCTLGSACVSGVCANGVCCNNACSGCNACTRASTGQADGLCAPVTAGLDPNLTCADETTTNQCGNDGTCDGTGACRKVATSHECSPAKCEGTTFTPASKCTGTGTCTTVTAQSCGSFQCSVTEGCKTTCTTQGDCGTQSYCNTSTGSCLAKTPTGGVCTQALACVSGSCVDGVCCENTCTGACKACSAAKTGSSDGLCRPVKVGTDPDSECAPDTSNACGLDGMCDGIGACRYQVTGTQCGTASCTGQGTYTPRGQCNGSGTCIAGSAGYCPNNMLCASSTACTTTCTERSTTGCPSGYKCVNGNSCQLISIPCNTSWCRPSENNICCTWTPSGTTADTPWTYTCESESACVAREYAGHLNCGSRADCPSGQFCCINRISCDGGTRPEPTSFCTSNVSACQDGPYNVGEQACDPSLSPSECMTGTCRANTCIRGTYTCQ